MVEGGSSGDMGLGQKHRPVNCCERKTKYLGKEEIGHTIGRGSMRKLFVIASIVLVKYKTSLLAENREWRVGIRKLREEKNMEE